MESVVDTKPSNEVGLHQTKKAKKEKVKKLVATKRERRKITKYLRKVWEFRDTTKSPVQNNHMSCTLAGDKKTGKNTILVYYTLNQHDCELLDLPREFVGARYVIEIKNVKSSKAKFVSAITL